MKRDNIRYSPVAWASSTSKSVPGWLTKSNEASRWIVAASAISLLLLLDLLALLLFVRSQNLSELCVAAANSEDCTTTPVLFSRQREYESMEHAQDQLWQDILPTKGFIQQGGDEAGEGNVFGIALFHQIHCLEMMRSSMQALAGKGELTEADSQVYLKHSAHCFDYLRQTLLCHADGTLEAAFNTSVGLQIDGMVEHKCGNLDGIFKKAKEDNFF